ncbi:MAG: NOP5/NOP56 family protein [Nanoarchaeota archaeon]|nr:NOP5/NOP56 family protein [Nanoarchaeota archaeon]
MFIHSNITGTYVFDEDFKVVERIKINLKDNFLEWVDNEKQLITKYKGKNLFYIGNKNEKLEGIKLTQDPKKLQRLTKYFKDNIKEFFKPNIKLTKKAVKEAVNQDMFIIHAINNIDELDKSANMLVKRLREWYSLYLPEFSRTIGDNESFTEIILKKTKEQLLEEIKINKEDSMGTDLDKKDLEPIINLAKKIQELYNLRTDHEKYLEKIMENYCPNLQALAGTTTGAKLIALARSLKRLVLFPASTIQLLGAEKALFRHLKTGARPPKYGILVNHPIVSKVPKKDKGKAARALADKIAIGVKIDYYKGQFIGDDLRKKLEERFTR